MQITNVTVGLGMTESLPDYANVKPSITMTATVESSDEEKEVIESLKKQCRAHCEGIIDDALEAAGERPKFTHEPLFRLYQWIQRKAMVVLPVDIDPDELPGRWERFGWNNEAQRYFTVMRRANEVMRSPNCPVSLFLDLSDGDVEARTQKWWDEQEWFRAYTMGNALVAVKCGLEIPDILSPFYGNGIRPEIVQTSEEILTAFHEHRPDADVFYIVSTQEEIDTFVEELVI